MSHTRSIERMQMSIEDKVEFLKEKLRNER